MEIIPVTLKYTSSWFNSDSWHETQFQCNVKVKTVLFKQQVYWTWVILVKCGYLYLSSKFGGLRYLLLKRKQSSCKVFSSLMKEEYSMWKSLSSTVEKKSENQWNHVGFHYIIISSHKKDLCRPDERSNERTNADTNQINFIAKIYIAVSHNGFIERHFLSFVFTHGSSVNPILQLFCSSLLKI